MIIFAVLVNFWWLKKPFLSIKAWLKDSDGLMVDSLFLILLINTSLIHSASSDFLKLQVLARSVNAPQKCSKGSLSLCFRFGSLYLSSVTFGGLLEARCRRSKNSSKEIDNILTLWFFWENTVFPSLPRAKKRNDINFFSASARLNPPNFFNRISFSLQRLRTTSW